MRIGELSKRTDVSPRSLRMVAPPARDPRNVIAVGDMSVPDLDGVLAPEITAVQPLSDAPAAHKVA
ncbi:hypothetical protein [Amycolatopsis regifaucium]|uniref:Uncharacterized protein n=1 Tax=Amycolatopsis regifaucium TaxID=546365 RepID=A0A154MQF7_9PSEU|nr:hypothetical protein [Amycolatopsis regifaucium]KZB86542.1 hypothetical protein AVL48_26230 [Amycolatopsis regifaucium]OKA03487.1 hypothetical protein ATP06_0235875 [Amycolatopsis regifaucium]SFJ15001.1 hypothetical protein SAMN04489731_11652 [Amycolatopsis regifaucium]